jgi:hypothetical protein
LDAAATELEAAASERAHDLGIDRVGKEAPQCDDISMNDASGAPA